jgi:predicted ATPase
LTERGELLQGIAAMRAGLNEYQVIGAEVLRPAFLSLIADAHGKAGQVEKAFGALDEAQALADKCHEQWWQAELYRLRGELILKRLDFQNLHQEYEHEAGGWFERAIAIAQEQKAKSLELRATRSLCRLWMRQSKRSEARNILLEVFTSFTEGFDTPDLQQAKELLDRL